MASASREPVLSDIMCLSIECADCGRERWWKERQLYRGGITKDTLLRELVPRLVCAHCREEGHLGKNLHVVPQFYTSTARDKAYRWQLNIQATPAMG